MRFEHLLLYHDTLLVADLLREGNGTLRYIATPSDCTNAGLDPHFAFPNNHCLPMYRNTLPFFARRVMSPARPDFPEYLNHFGLGRMSPPPDVFDLLGHTGGVLPGDKWHFDPLPDLTKSAIVLRDGVDRPIRL